MTTKEINSQRNERGVFSDGNDVAGWFALSRDGVHMITFYQGRFTFSAKEDVNRFYTFRGFALRVGQLIKRGY